MCGLFCSIFFLVKSQDNGNFGGKVGVSAQFGTHIQQLGLMYQIYYLGNHFQINHGISINYNRKTLGPKFLEKKGKGLEIKIHLGGQALWGKETYPKRYLLSEYSLLASNPYSVGYTFNLYLDQVKTSQVTGSVFTNINHFGFVFENDFLGFWKGYEDKFRTGAVALSYTLDSIQFSLQTTHWTGKSIDGPKIKDNQYPSKHGYRDLKNATYGKLSHGILALRVDYYYKYKQSFRVESGIDAEQIRHALQNKLFHDFIISIFNPKAENPHFPMLQEDGSPYLFKEGQKIRNVRPYFQVGSNNGMFY